MEWPVVHFSVGLLAVLLSCLWLGFNHGSQSTSEETENYISIPGMDPEQIHLSLGADESQMVVTWATQQVPDDAMKRTRRPLCEYWTESEKVVHVSKAEVTAFQDGGPEKRTIATYRCTLSDLAPETKYVYRCGVKGQLSEALWFVTHPAGTDWSPSVAVFGDMGVKNARAQEPIMDDALGRDRSEANYDLVLGLGDYAYDMAFENGRIGDEWFRIMQPLFGRIPFHSTAGNHECQYNFSHYESRFTLIDQPTGRKSNQMYSFNLGPAHIVVLSTEYYFFLHFFGTEFVRRQAAWLEADLTQANKERHIRPWIITISHRPMYCSEAGVRDCNLDENVIRTGAGWGIGKPIAPGFPLEPILARHGVDLSLWGHKHSYERTWPVYDRKVYNGSESQPYHNARAPIQITSGAAGCVFLPRPFKPAAEIEDWSAFRSLEYSYSRLKLYNATHLGWEHVSAERPGHVLDKIQISKTQPRPQLRFGTEEEIGYHM